jgi:polysaccharide deacetylase 2 family uncharacterized protein YibQ
MAHGVLSGIALGAVFSVAVAGVVSVVVPMQPQPAPQTGSAGTVAIPEATAAQPDVVVTGERGTAMARPQVALRAPVSEDLPTEPAPAALAPQIATDPGTGAIAAPLDTTAVTPPAPESDGVVSAPAAPEDVTVSDRVPEVSSAALQPETGLAGTLTAPRPLPQGVTARVAQDLPVLPNPLALAPMMPDDSADADVSGQTGADTQTATAGEETLDIRAPRPRILPVPDSSAATIGASIPGSVVGARFGTPANSLITRDAQSGVDTVTQTVGGSMRPDQPINLYAQPFQNPEGLPLMSIVLIDTGADLDAAGIGLPALSSFPYPVSFAVDARLTDAADRVARYRGEGFEVLAMVNLPQGAQPTDAEVSISVALNGMPEIVGILEGVGEGLQGSREVADQVTRILLASGHGLVTQSKGLNSMPKLAVKEGVPAAAVFRDFDSEGQGPRVIRRFLDQAAFKAGQEGGVIMLGRLRPETIEALLVWGLADRAGTVALAPVSAVLLGQR